jgi:hypothetical protein
MWGECGKSRARRSVCLPAIRKLELPDTPIAKKRVECLEVTPGLLFDLCYLPFVAAVWQLASYTWWLLSRDWERRPYCLWQAQKFVILKSRGLPGISWHIHTSLPRCREGKVTVPITRPLLLFHQQSLTSVTLLLDTILLTLSSIINVWQVFLLSRHANVASYEGWVCTRHGYTLLPTRNENARCV